MEDMFDFVKRVTIGHPFYADFVENHEPKAVSSHSFWEIYAGVGQVSETQRATNSGCGGDLF